MKKVIWFLPFFLLMFQAGYTQEADSSASTWKLGGRGLLTLNQVGLFNWAAGGQSSVTLIGNVGAYANYAKGSTTWDNSIELAYGFVKNNSNGTRFSSFLWDSDVPVTKAEDKIELLSKFGAKAFNEKFSYSAILNFRTQFDFGYGNIADFVADTDTNLPRSRYISRFFAPAYTVLAIGLDYKPDDHWSLFLSPLSGKFTFVLDDTLSARQAFGVNNPDDPGSSTFMRSELGATFRARYKNENIITNVGLESMLELFSNYLFNPQNIDIRWNTIIDAKVNKYLGVNFFLDVIYDHDVQIQAVDNEGQPVFIDVNGEMVQKTGPRVQVKEVFGVGLTYKFGAE